MLKEREAYLCLTAIVRARECALLSDERAERMIDAPSYEEAAKILTDCGWEDMSRMDASQVEKTVASHRDSIFEELRAVAPDPELVDFFKIKYDYHNAKVVIKSRALGTDADYLLVDSGRIPGKQLKELFLQDRFNDMPGELGPAVEEAKHVLVKSMNPQLSDFVLDGRYLKELEHLADRTGNEFLIGYTKLATDTANLKAAVRSIKLGKDVDFLKTVLVEGGTVPVYRLLASLDNEALQALYAHTRLEKAALLGAEAIGGEPVTAFEKECDNVLNRYLQDAKLISFGPAPLISYLAAVENETTAVRMILTGRIAGVKAVTLKERLRDQYA